MPSKTEADWYQPVAELMSREGLSIEEACTKLRVAITTLEAKNTFRTKLFQRLLRTERNRYFREIGTNREWDKKCAVGKLLACAEELYARGDYDKAAEVVLKACKVENWVGETGTVNVFAGLKGSDMEAIRNRLKEDLEKREKASVN